MGKKRIVTRVKEKKLKKILFEKRLIFRLFLCF